MNKFSVLSIRANVKWNIVKTLNRDVFLTDKVSRRSDATLSRDFQVFMGISLYIKADIQKSYKLKTIQAKTLWL